MLVWIIAAAIALLGAALVTRGLRGRRVNDHPICRKCKFDLIGVYPMKIDDDGGTGVSPVQTAKGDCKCPECGRDLNHERSIRRGARRKRPISTIGGAVLLLIGLSLGAARLWGDAKNFDWNTVKPEWMLLAALHDPGGLNDIVFSELHRRARADVLSDQALHRLAMEGLARQAAAHQWAQLEAAPSGDREGWSGRWATFIRQAIGRGLLNDAQTLAFLRHTLFPHFEIDRQAPAGGTLRMSVGYQTDYAGLPSLCILAEFSTISIDHSVVLTRNVGHFSIRPHETSGGFGSRLEVPLTDVEPGLHIITVTQRFRYYPECGASFGLHEHMVEPALEWRSSEDYAVLVQPTDAPLFTAIVKPELRDAMYAEARKQYGTIRVVDEHWSFVSDFETHRRFPIGLCHELIVVTSDGEISDGHHVEYNGGGFRGGWSQDPFPAIDESVTVILRPDHEMARRVPALEEFWGEEIVINDVPVVRMTAEEVRREAEAKLRRRLEDRAP